MKSSFLLLSAAILLSVTGCDKNNADTTLLTLSFTPTFSAKQIDSKEFYQVGDASCQFTRYTLFLSDLALVAEDNSEYMLSEVEFLNFNEDTDATTLMETIKRSYRVPNGKYKALKLGYGLKAQLNAKSPADFNSDHVLAKESGQYWDSWRSYIFMKIEGKGSSAAHPSINMAYHCGADPVYTTDTKNLTFDLNGTESNTDFVIDLARIFEENGEWFDVGGTPFTHSVNDLKIGEKFMRRLSKAVQVK